MDPKERGEATEAIVIGELKRRGYTILTPFGDSARYDIVIDDGEELSKVQIKTGRHRNGSVICPTRSVNWNKGTQKTYDGDIDEFMVYSFQTDKVYRIPIEETGPGGFSLRVEDAKKDSPKINWAEDYEL